MLRNNPYYYHPQPAAMLAADDVLLTIASHPKWVTCLEQGKMLGVLVVETSNDNKNLPVRVHNINNVYYLAGYSGVVNGLDDEDKYFVPPIYDLQNPDDFYLQKDAEITAINHRLKTINENSQEAKQLKRERHQLSIALQKEIFSHFSIIDSSGTKYRNIIDIFADAKRGLPPGGSGECAAPRLLQYALQNGLKPLYLAEFWYGQSPKNIHRVHGCFYSSCIEKCSPILKYQLHIDSAEEALPPSSVRPLQILYEDDFMLAVAKQSGVLSVPAKDLSLPNIEMMLHASYPEVKGPMLVHRLDQSTSGILLAAKDAQTHKLLQQQFETRTVHKRYIAQLRGKVASSCGIIDLPLTVNPDDRPRQVVDYQFGKKATTYYEVITEKWIADDGIDVNSSIVSDEKTTMLFLYPLTGRTHQLRVHCASPFGLDHPIVGDLLYDILEPNQLDVKRLMLHAEQITFQHPHTGKTMTISAPIH